MSQKKNAAILFILVTVLIDSIGFGVIIPVMPKLISELGNVDNSTAASYGGILFAAYSVMQFIFAPIVGGLSDQYGRRPILLAALFGFGIDYLFLIYAPSIAWLIIGRMIAGIMGASFTTAAAYIADISEPEKRAQNFGMIGAAFGLGFILGPIIGGSVAQFGTKAPFVTSAILTLINWLYGFFVLPESLKPENRRKFNFKRANPLGAVMNIKKYPMLIGMIAALFLAFVSSFSTQGTWNYFAKEKFNWTEQEIGYSLSFVGLMIAIVQGGLTRLIIPKLGVKKSIYLGFTFSILGALAYAFVTQAWMMYAIMVPFSLGGLAGPSIQGLISGQVPANEQGELQGSLTSMNSLAAIVGPVLMTYLFHYFTKKGAPIYFPGAPFLASVFLTGISFIIVASTLKKFGVK